MKDNQKLMFFYFMTRTYEELYILYIEGNINFPMIANGTVRICKFMTLQKAIEEKKKEYEGNDNTYIKDYEEISKSMFTDFETKARKPRKDLKEMEKSKIYLKKFEVMKNYFDNLNVKDESKGLGLEEKMKTKLMNNNINNLDINKI